MTIYILLGYIDRQYGLSYEQVSITLGIADFHFRSYDMKSKRPLLFMIDLVLWDIYSTLVSGSMMSGTWHHNS